MAIAAVLLGTGCPVVHPERRGAATLIATDDTQLLIDCGSGVTQRLVEAGTCGADLDALLLTHLHSDHLVDFYQLVISSWHQGRSKPWRVYGPPPVLEHIRREMELWREERALRIAFEQRGSTDGLEIDPIAVTGGDRIEIGDVCVTVVEVEHAPVIPALGFVFDAGDGRIVHSGDTRRCEALIAAGQGADLLIHEVYLCSGLKADGHRRAETLRNVASYHTLSSEVGSVARDMAAKALAMTHFVPPEFDRWALLEEVGRDFIGPLFVGEDLMRFDLAAGIVSWREMSAKLRW